MILTNFWSHEHLSAITPHLVTSETFSIFQHRYEYLSENLTVCQRLGSKTVYNDINIEKKNLGMLYEVWEN